MPDDGTGSPSSPHLTRRGVVDKTDDVDPVEFLRKMLQISPEDAAAVREDAAAKQNRADPKSSDDQSGR